MKKIIVLILLCFTLNVKAEETLKEIPKQKGIIIEGDLIEYVNVYSKYQEKGAIFYDEKGKDLSNDINITYFNHKRQVSKIDTRMPDNYLVKYKINYGNQKYEAKRILIITDEEPPKFNEFDTKTITNLETATYNPNDGVEATDNSEKVKVNCYNSISRLQGNYSIICKAEDKNGNTTTKNKLIKVVENIKFTYKDKLEIIFPEGNYTYMYSINGKDYIKCNRKETIDIKEGYVNALVYENNEMIMSNTYLIN